MNLAMVIPSGISAMKLVTLTSNRFCFHLVIDQPNLVQITSIVVGSAVDFLVVLATITLSIMSIHLINDTAKQAKRQISKKDIQYTIRAIIVNISNVAVWLSVVIYAILQVDDTAEISEAVTWVVLSLLSVRAIINPTVYTLSSSTMQKPCCCAVHSK